MLFITYEIKGKWRADFPLRVEVPPKAGIGVHFPRAEGPVCMFSNRAKGAVVWFYNKRRPF